MASKLIKTPEGSFRERRGKIVRIPDAWVGQFTTEKTIRQRPSKLVGKVKRSIKFPQVEHKDRRDSLQGED